MILCAFVVVVGVSMWPALNSGDRVEVCPADSIRKGDIVVFQFGARQARGCAPLVKRVVGVPGDSLTTALPVPKWTEARRIPEGKYYVRGDNGGEDSRKFGLISRDQITGVVKP